jgi:S-adenosylmethionine:tRNA ribosyltransferase-isomerase
LARELEVGDWWAVLFGAGDWRTPTELRPAPPAVAAGEILALAGELRSRVSEVSDASPRLVRLRFEATGAALWRALYRAGKPVQYSYLEGELALWHVQTSYAARPWSVEPPSAGLPLTPRVLARLRARGVRLAWLTHAAGLSSTGDPSVDRLLPLPERYELPAETVAALLAAKRENRRVIAAGTTVTRALEGCVAEHGRLVAGTGVTDLRLDGSAKPRVVDGLFTGLHEPDSSHFSLLEAFAPRALLERAAAHAERAGYLGHEFGDSCLVLAA